MTTNSKPELCDVCGGARKMPRYNHSGGAWRSYAYLRGQQPCTEIFHTQAGHSDKHKRVAERLFTELFTTTRPWTMERIQQILTEEYPNE